MNNRIVFKDVLMCILACVLHLGTSGIFREQRVRYSRGIMDEATGRLHGDYGVLDIAKLDGKRRKTNRFLCNRADEAMQELKCVAGPSQ